MDSFNDENQVRICCNWSNSSASVGCLSWAQDFNFAANFHVASNLIPTLDHLTNTDVEVKWLSSIVAWVKLGSVSQCSLIMHVNLLSLTWSGSFLTFGKNFNGVLFSELFAESGECGKDGQSTEENSFHHLRVVIFINIWFINLKK